MFQTNFPPLAFAVSFDMFLGLSRPFWRMKVTGVSSAGRYVIFTLLPACTVLGTESNFGVVVTVWPIAVVHTHTSKTTPDRHLFDNLKHFIVIWWIGTVYVRTL